MLPTLNTITVPTNITITYVPPQEENMMVRHLELTRLVQELLAAITRWYYTTEN